MKHNETVYGRDNPREQLQRSFPGQIHRSSYFIEIPLGDVISMVFFHLLKVQSSKLYNSKHIIA